MNYRISVGYSYTESHSRILPQQVKGDKKGDNEFCLLTPDFSNVHFLQKKKS